MPLHFNNVREESMSQSGGRVMQPLEQLLLLLQPLSRPPHLLYMQALLHTLVWRVSLFLCMLGSFITTDMTT